MSRRSLALLALVGVIPLLGYQFAIGNQVEQLSLIMRGTDPGFLTKDFYVNAASEFGPRHYYSQLLSLLNRLAPIPVLFIVLTCLTNFALACASFVGARRLLNATPGAAAIAALIIVLNSSFSLGLASSIRFESYQPASAAIVFAIAGFILLIVRKTLWATAAFVCSSLLHPLMGLEVAAIAWCSCGLASIVRASSVRDALRGIIGYLPSGLIFIGAFFVIWGLPSLGADAERLSDADFFAILPEFRAPHHYLASQFPLNHYKTASFFLIGTAWLIAARARNSGWSFEIVTLILAIVVVVLACVASYFLVDLMHNRAAATAQVFRMLFLLKWIGLLVFAYSAAEWLRRGSLLNWVAALAPILASQEAQPTVMLASIFMVESARGLKIGRFEQMLAGGLLAAFSAVVFLSDGSREETIRLGIGIACLAAWFSPSAIRAATQPAALALAAGAIAIGSWNRTADVIRSPTFHPIYTWSDLKGADVEAAVWAKANTPKDALWITPPDFENFRLLASRAIIADYTSIPFSDGALREWRRRMFELYGPVSAGGFSGLSEMKASYRHVSEADLRNNARRWGAEYAVLYAETAFSSAPVYANSEYKIVRLAAD